MNKELKWIKILDISRILAGPYCTQVLSDLGASVTKVESDWRRYPKARASVYRK